MKIAATLTVFALAPTALLPAPPNDNPSVTVSIDLKTNVPINTMQYAENIAGSMFAKAGVSVIWQSSPPDLNEDQRPILVTITSATPASLHPGALAFAQVFTGTYIRIFYDRIENPYCPNTTRMMLAHVLVHEITHILEGINGHSPEGVMKAHWTRNDIVTMAFKPLPFTAEDIQLLHAGLSRRNHHEPQLLIADRRH